MKRKWSYAVLALPLLAVGSTARAHEFVNCSQDEMDTISNVELYAFFALIGAGQDLASVENGGDASRFESYFGPASDDRVSYVREMLNAAYSGGLPNAKYYCAGGGKGCLQPTALAWTEHGSAFEEHPRYPVYICDLFFEHPDRQLGTLVHEWTHLYGTSDISDAEAESTSDFAQLARDIAEQDPDRALALAINYEYYVLD